MPRATASARMRLLRSVMCTPSAQMHLVAVDRLLVRLGIREETRSVQAAIELNQVGRFIGQPLVEAGEERRAVAGVDLCGLNVVAGQQRLYARRVADADRIADDEGVLRRHRKPLLYIRSNLWNRFGATTSHT